MFADPGFWVVQILNSLQLAMLLFLLSVGLTVILGMLDFVNLAHGSLYALGALMGYSLSVELGSVWWGLALAPVAVAAVGAVLWLAVIDRMRRAGPMRQVLVTFGLLFVLVDVQRLVWGSDQLGVHEAPFAGSVTVLGEPYPAYRRPERK